MPEPCRLYLIRHGLAEERGEAWPDDSRRPLSEEGMSRLRKEARGLVRLGVTFDVVLTSPLVCARRPRTWHRRAGSPPRRLAPGVCVQERLDLPDRRQESAASGARHASLVH